MIVLLWPRCRVPGSPLTVNIYSGDIVYTHTHAAPLHSLERQVRHGLDVGSEVLVLGSAMVECWVICRHCPSVARPGAGGGVVRGGGRGAAVLRRVRLVRGRRRARRGEDGGQLRGLALDLLYILCSDSFRF